ncbi:MAG TPA: hypothetical protein VL357_03510 [Rariglobus sp.]|nr:hypothetical protein [Rariglobus sp.]
MNLPNVIGFFGMGFVMELLPRLAPEWVSGEASRAGADTGALWFMVMGAVMMIIGGSYLARMAWETLPREKYHAMVRDIVAAEKRSEASSSGVGAGTVPRA